MRGGEIVTFTMRLVECDSHNDGAAQEAILEKVIDETYSDISNETEFLDRNYQLAVQSSGTTSIARKQIVLAVEASAVAGRSHAMSRWREFYADQWNHSASM